jgi:CheY-like chemotaxis protein
MRALTILVVEDHALIGLLLGELLVEMGHSVAAVERTRAGAVAAAARFAPDMIIADVFLGADDGVAAVDEILRARWTPHVFVSGFVSPQLRARPGVVCLRKPYRDSDLEAAMERALATAPRK